MNEVPKDKWIKLANWLLSSFVKDSLHEEFLGDLMEIYQDRISSQGKFKAKLLYWFDAMHLLFGFFSFNFFNDYSPSIMYKHYLTVARRTLIKNKFYSLVNIVSLAVGMAVCLLIFQYVYFESTFDTFHQDYQNTYRVIIEDTNSESNNKTPNSGYALGVAAKEEIPEVLEYVRKNRFNRGAVVTNPNNQTVFHEEVNDLLFVDPSFFEVFNFPLQSGKSENLFEDKYSVVITAETAKKYFGSEDPVGKILHVNGPPSPGNYRITGVLEDLPLNSHLQFDFLMPIENYIEYGWSGAVKKNGGWNGFSVISYLTLEPSADVDLVCNKLNQLLARNRSTGKPGNDIDKKVNLQRVSDIYLKSDHYSYAGYLNATGSIQNNKIFTAISFFILFIAWVNYINLSTARSMNRAKEVGVRKSIGAFRQQIMSQFITESILVNMIAGVLAIGLAILCLPLLSEIVGKTIELSFLRLPMFWILFFVVVLLGALLSGLYPAFILSSYKPIHILSSIKTRQSGKMDLRKGLITFQFLTSLILISATYLVYQQVTLLRNHELNIDIEKVLVTRVQQGGVGGEGAVNTFQSFSNEMMRHNSISAVSSSVYTPGQFGVTAYRRVGQPESSAPYTRSIFAGKGFLQTYGLELIAGNSFQPYQSDEEVVIINQSACKSLGFESPQQAIQQRLEVGTRKPRIVGVVEDFHWHTLKESHTPYVIDLGSVDEMHPFVAIRMDMSNVSESLAQIESTFRSFYPDLPFDYFFANESFNRLYQSEVRFGKIFFSFALFAIFISCIGLLALVSYSATLRVKEIGIRKVLGANVGSLMFLLSREYLLLLFLANLLAAPFILYWGSAWLDNYAIRTGLSVDNFLFPGFILLFISLCTVSYIAFLAARANPIESLRKE